MPTPASHILHRTSLGRDPKTGFRVFFYTYFSTQHESPAGSGPLPTEVHVLAADINYREVLLYAVIVVGMLTGVFVGLAISAVFGSALMFVSIGFAIALSKGRRGLFVPGKTLRIER